MYQVVEPNPRSVEYFKGVVSKDKALSKVTFQWFNGFFEPFCDQFRNDGSPKFDFAHYVRVFYHIDSVSALKTTYEVIIFLNFLNLFVMYVKPFYSNGLVVKLSKKFSGLIFQYVSNILRLSLTSQELLAKDGIVAVVGENENAFWPRMMPFLAKHGMKHECFTCSGPVSEAYFLPGWKKQAESNGWKYNTYIKK